MRIGKPPYAKGKKCYRGPKSVDIVIEREESLKLAQALLGVAIEVRKAVDQGDPIGPPIDIVIFDGNKRKNGTFTIAVSSVERS